MQQSATDQTYTAKAGSKSRRILLAVLIIGTFMANLDAVMVSIALPTITTFFGVSISQSQWSVTGYILAMSSLIIVFGKLSEYIGKTKLYMTGFAIFTVSSLACGMATGITQLIVFRIIQGIGGSMVYGVVGALLYQASLPEEQGRAMGYVATAVAGATLIGPALGGFITDLLGWQYIFLINVPIGIAMLTLAFKYMKVPESRIKNIDMDWIGSGILIIFMVSLLMFLDEMAGQVTLSVSLIIYGLVFSVSLALFIIWESRCEKPLLDLSIFGNRKFIMPTVSNFLFYAALNIANILGPFYFEGVMGFAPSQVGIIFIVVPLLMFLASPIGGWLYDKRHWKYAAGFGASIVAVSYMLQAFASLTTDLWLIVVAFAMRGIGSGLYQGPNNTEILDALPMRHRAVASSVGSTGRNLGIALGVSSASIILTLEMGMAGYHGSVLSSGPSLLSSVIAVAMLAAGAIGIMATIVSISRNI